MFEIVTTDGVVSSTSNALAEAMAEIIADHRATESDLLAAVGMDLDNPTGDAAVAPATTAAA